MGQKFYASPTDVLQHPNGAIGHRSGSSMDCLGPYAKVRNCPIEGTPLRVTAYATGYADTYFSIPACCKVHGRHVAGYFTTHDDGVVFCVMDKHKDRLGDAFERGIECALVHLNKEIADGKEFPDAAWSVAYRLHVDQKALEKAYDDQCANR